jgi:polysulfide reductase chain C
MEATAMVWEWPIWVYLFVAGVAGGGFFATFLVSQFSGGRYKHLLKISAWIGVPLVGIGVLLLVIDLGNQLYFWHLMVRFLPISAMSIGTWILTLWAIIGVILLILWLAEDDVPVFRIVRGLVPLTKVLGWINLVLSALLIAYTGVLLSTTSRELWSTVLLPVLFVVSAISTGWAATLLVAALLKKEIPHAAGQAGAILTVIEVVALIAFLIAVPAEALFTGSLSLWFWIGVVVIGLLVPFALELWSQRARARTLLIVASAFCVLLGGMVLRAVVVIGGQLS